LDVVDSLQGIFVARAEILHLLVGNEGFLRLLAFLVQDAQVVPHLVFESVQRRGFDDVFEGIAVVSILIIDNS